MPAWLVWVLLAVALGAAETMTLDLVLGFAAVGALVAGGVALAGGPVALQIVSFAATSTALLALVRPVAKRHLQPQHPELRSGVDALVGVEARVLVRTDRNGGRVKLRGEEWTARTPDATTVVEPGEAVRVIAIEGATALVYPTEV